MKFGRLNLCASDTELAAAVAELIKDLAQRVAGDTNAQLNLFERKRKNTAPTNADAPSNYGVVDHLSELVQAGHKFATIYADPPWPYENQASRAAAANHYTALSIDEICREPVAVLADENAHLHLWTTNAFLRPAFDVIEVWGFEYKSCFVWVKPEVGMGNYWRVSHEYVTGSTRQSHVSRPHAAKLDTSPPNRPQPQARCRADTDRESKPRSVLRTLRPGIATELSLDGVRTPSRTTSILTLREIQMDNATPDPNSSADTPCAPVLNQHSDQQRLVGYARLSIDDQDLPLQIDALTKHGIKSAGRPSIDATGGSSFP